MELKKDVQLSENKQYDIFENLLDVNTEKTKSNLDVLKELFEVEKSLNTKTELTLNQIVLVNQKQSIAHILDWASLRFVLTDFKELMVSNNRKGRSEFVDAFKSEREKENGNQGGFFSKLKDTLTK